MRRIALLAVAATLAAGCGWDGPARDVRVVPAESDVADVEVASPDPDGPPADVAGIDPTGVPARPEEPTAGLEDRPMSLGALDMPDTVAVIGDSLTVAATDRIVESLSRAGVQKVVVDAQENRRMVVGGSGVRSGVAAIEDVLVDEQPDLWVIALGTNDVGSGTVSDRFVDDVRTAVGAVPATAPLVWVDVWIGDRLEEVVEANTILRDELDRRSAPTDVVDWFSSGAGDGLITADGIHLTERGEERFAAEITDVVVATAFAAG